MNTRTSRLATVAVVMTATNVLAPRAQASHQNAEVIIEWNQLLQQNVAGPPFSQVRTYAMMHIAMADAVVAIQGRYEPYHVRVWAPRGGSAESAAAQAAHDVLVALIPASQVTFDTALQTRLTAVPPGLRELGVQVGKKAASGVLAGC